MLGFSKYMTEMRTLPSSASIALILLLGSVLSACVSETTGGFEQAPDEEALENYLALAQGYLEQQDLQAARRHLNNAANIDPNNSDAYGLWGLIYTLEGDLGLADESFNRAIRLNRGNSRVRNNYAAFLFANERYEEAYNHLEVVVSDTAYQGRAQAFENMGLAAQRLNRLEDAEYAFTRALQLNSNRIRSTLELADISLQRGDTRAAQNYYSRFQTLQQFFNIQPNARSLWVAVRLEQSRGMESRMREYGATLAELYPDSNEYELYRQLIND
ncbi:MAG: type IV pilus biogenesis/stability protein PilW [Gammaproteobacteria bacterium]|nr:type IV pilus biogenesis/stability protein PilW [Gammaproteobacteria bacterium]MAY03099.1 type IV pilus biogenesis/stability protein PilW [Gammaproteobacteria bacterium]|tara:strand:- start:90054 stop:90872 length:819 start_codon:yes stop_codon:yes gene_type:complete